MNIAKWHVPACHSNPFEYLHSNTRLDIAHVCGTQPIYSRAAEFSTGRLLLYVVQQILRMLVCSRDGLSEREIRLAIGLRHVCTRRVCVHVCLGVCLRVCTCVGVCVCVSVCV